MSFVRHDLQNIDELEDKDDDDEFNRLPRLEGSGPPRLPPLKKLVTSLSGSKLSKTSSKTSASSNVSRKPSPELLHLSALCENNPQEDPILPHIQHTTSNQNVMAEVVLSGPTNKGLDQLEMEKLVSETGAKIAGRRGSFAAYHKCRARSMSLPGPRQPANMTAGESLGSGSIHRTISGLGLMGERVAEEELGKSKILSLFEADINNKKIKTFFNGVAGVLEDRQKQDRIFQEEKMFIIHPLSSFRLFWDTFLLLAIMVMMVILPLKLAFLKIFDVKPRDQERETWYPVIIILDLVFLADVVLSFFTGTIELKKNHPQINLNRREIQIKYLKTWFVPDLLSSIPFDIIGSEIAGSVNGSVNKNEMAIAAGASKAFLAAKVLKTFSLVRVLRLGRLHFILKRWVQIFELSPLFIKIFQLLCLFFMIAHWSACIQFFVVYIRGFPEKSWPVLLNIQDSPWSDQYIWAVFRSLSHMITIGYGKDPPQDTVEAMMIIPSMLIGAFFYMMIVSQMTKTISMFRMGDIRYTEKLKDIDEFTRKYNMGSDIHQRMHEFFHHKYAGAIHDDDDLIKELPLALKIDVIKAKNKEILENVFFLRSACDGFTEQFLLSTLTSVYMTGDIIVRSEDMMENLFVIKKGTVSIEFTTPGNTFQDEIIVRTYGFFGETPMLLKKKADMIVYAETACDFIMIPKFMFYSLIDRYSLFKNQMLLVAHSRIGLQGIDPNTHAPFLKKAFEEAACDRIAARSSEDILELASQRKLDTVHMQEFRCRNSIKHSVFRKVDPRKKGDKPSSMQTPIDPLKHHHDPSIHVSVSIHDDRIKTIVGKDRSASDT